MRTLSDMYGALRAKFGDVNEASETGGNCTAVEFTDHEGTTYLITDGNASAPGSAHDPCTLSANDEDGEPLGFAEFRTLGDCVHALLFVRDPRALLEDGPDLSDALFRLMVEQDRMRAMGDLPKAARVMLRPTLGTATEMEGAIRAGYPIKARRLLEEAAACLRAAVERARP